MATQCTCRARYSASSGTFQAVVGHTYRVEYTDGLAVPAPDWKRLGTSDIVATSATIVVTDNIGPGLQRFYRLLQVD